MEVFPIHPSLFPWTASQSESPTWVCGPSVLALRGLEPCCWPVHCSCHEPARGPWSAGLWLEEVLSDNRRVKNMNRHFTWLNQSTIVFQPWSHLQYNFSQSWPEADFSVTLMLTKSRACLDKSPCWNCQFAPVAISNHRDGSSFFLIFTVLFCFFLWGTFFELKQCRGNFELTC